MRREKDASGVRGFIMRNPSDPGEVVFRVYDKKNKRKFKDYIIAAEEIEAEILSHWYAFKGKHLDWSNHALGIGKKKKQKKR